MNTLPKTNFTDVLNPNQLDFLAANLPEPSAFTGRPAYLNSVLLPGILKVLRSGCRWRDLGVPGSGLPSGVTHWRRLNFWQTRPGMVPADKGDDSRGLRAALRTRGIRTNIPERQYKKRRKRGRPPKDDSELGKTRFTVERTNAWFKGFRRIHFRFDRTLVMFEAWILLACVVICARRLIP